MPNLEPICKDREGNLVVPEFPTFIDSSMRADFVACPRMFYYRHILGLKPAGGKGPHTHFGACFAKGLEVFRRNFYGSAQLPFRESLALGAEAMIRAWGRDTPDPDDTSSESAKKKNFAALCDAYYSYFVQYPPDQDYIKPLIVNGEPAVEFTFAAPLPGGLKHPVSGEPLLYIGKFDMLAVHGNGVFVDDEKTTSQLGPQWANGFKLRSQLTGYVWGAREYGYPVQGAVVRGLSILAKDIGHAMVIEQRPQYMIDRWKEQLIRDVERMLRCWESGYWDFNLDGSCSSYGGCTFLQLDTVKDPLPWIETHYVVDRWDPMAEDSEAGY